MLTTPAAFRSCFVIDINSGDTVEWLRIEGVVRELFDVAVLPGVRNPAARLRAVARGAVQV
jgi:Domain of unknown function (DUF4915)